MAIMNPGAAFSAGIEKFMLDKAAAERQARQDAIAARAAEDRHVEAEAALARDKMENALRLEDRKAAKVTRTLAGTVPGDIMDSGTVAEAKVLGIPVKTYTDSSKDQVKVEQPSQVVQEMGGLTPAPPAPEPLPLRFGGNVAQATKIAEDKKQEEYVKSLPEGSNERLAAEYELRTGRPAPAAILKEAGDTSAPIFRQDPRKGTVERFIDGKWSPWQGDAPKGTHWITQPAPININAGNARQDARLDKAYTSALTELEKAATPLAAQVKNIDDLGIMLNQQNPTADAHIAPQIIKALVGGQGSGIRINNAEIERVVGARSRWDSLKLKLNAWDPESGKNLILTDEQRADMRKLTKAIRKKAYDKLQEVTKVRHSLDDADDVDTIRKTMTALKDDMYSAESDDTDASGGALSRVIRNSKTGETKTQTSSDGGKTWK